MWMNPLNKTVNYFALSTVKQMLHLAKQPFEKNTIFGKCHFTCAKHQKVCALFEIYLWTKVLYISEMA